MQSLFDNPLPVLAYILISTFTPGPSNVTSASMGLLHGYRSTLRLQMGLAAGVLIIMAVSGAISTALLATFPALEPVLRIVGAAYILYLAFLLAKASYGFAGTDLKPLGFGNGLSVQLLNPKLYVYAFTLFSAFLAAWANGLGLVLFAALVLAAISFVSTTAWALFGAGIKTYLQNPRLRTAVNLLLSLSLVYAALAVLGVG